MTSERFEPREDVGAAFRASDIDLVEATSHAANAFAFIAKSISMYRLVVAMLT